MFRVEQEPGQNRVIQSGAVRSEGDKEKQVPQLC
ncbi:Uncharacterised protein [Enterobacter cloacae]|jgi:hypothetical protein|nr:Uncharacterised protein [Enterobacter cloacae]CZW28986.1 Uncharacterised protein [Enterobacter cloacae]VAK76648.1 Uncharacterised protein [Enterobacter cloacae]